MSGDLLAVTARGGRSCGIRWTEARDAVNRQGMDRPARPPQKGQAPKANHAETAEPAFSSLLPSL